MNNYQRAKKVVAEIEAGEWEGEYNRLARDTFIIKKGGVALWVANLSFDCEAYEPIKADVFGIWKHWVWFKAQPLRRKTTRESIESASSSKLKAVFGELDG